MPINWSQKSCDTIPKIRNKYYQKRNCTASVPRICRIRNRIQNQLKRTVRSGPEKNHSGSTTLLESQRKTKIKNLVTLSLEWKPGSRWAKTNLSSPSTFLIFLASSLSRSFSLVSAFSSSALYVSFTLPASREAERYNRAVNWAVFLKYQASTILHFPKSSVADPWHFGVDPDLDSRIHAPANGSGSCYFRHWPF